MRPLSARNPRIQRLGRLARRRGERTEQRAFVVEGPVLVTAALDAGLTVTEVFVADGATEQAAVAALVDRADATGTASWSLPSAVLDRVGDATTSQGVTAIVDLPDPVLPDVSAAPFVLVLADVADPGNSGTLIRAAVAAGAGAVICAGGVDPYSPQVVRSSAGAVFLVPVLAAATPAAAIELLGGTRQLVGTVVRDAEPYDRTDLTGPLALVLGNEAHGLDPGTAERLDALVTIPMAGPTESRHVAMAGPGVCVEVLRQRRSA